MCGVIGLSCEASRPDLGQLAAELLKTLEYRGYDSTGAALQGDGLEVELLKGVGAPSVMVHRLGIVGRGGQQMCGQVRWATFGAVDEKNAQPHVVRCKTFLYGAHNGNVTNCDDLKQWLERQGHQVLSDNDGEMVVHTVEHEFAALLQEQDEARRQGRETRRAAMREAIVRAASRLHGSYAAVIVDPVARLQWAIKQGSSLYFGLGQDGAGRKLAVSSSDLSAVLKVTRTVVPLSEGECVEYDAHGYQLFAVVDRPARDGAPARAARTPIAREATRSRLRAQDAALLPPFQTFMEQEIASQEATSRNVIALFRGASRAAAVLQPHLDAMSGPDRAQVAADLDALRDQPTEAKTRQAFFALVDSAPFRALLARVPADQKARGVAGSTSALTDKLISSEVALFAELLERARSDDDRLAVRLLDVLLERDEMRAFRGAVDRFLDACAVTVAKKGRVYLLSCGSSYHAAKAASLFFNEVAGVHVHAVLPGEFRGEHARALSDHDLLVAVSQSGETKDLIDVLNDVIATGKSVVRVAVVNNVNSTLAQEKCSIVIPLRCGPEVAVPATKSFINQLTIFYCLALELGERLGAHGDAVDRKRRLDELPALLGLTVRQTDFALDGAAELLFLAPSMHVLATRLIPVALEGALKIREVVLNHTQGIEASEFKHGPNTILGFNTVLGLNQVHRLLEATGAALGKLAHQSLSTGAGPDALQSTLAKAAASLLTGPEPSGLDRPALLRALYQDYPLIYVTGPNERDVALTVSQMNTHKIRGATTVVIAEDNPALREAASKPPANRPGYRFAYVTLPQTNDNLMVVFTATVALQRLALKMSLRKATLLDGMGIADHGVHPDVPKNVSKAITVD